MKVRTIVKLLQFCLKSTEFVHSGVHYKQHDGVAMGSPVSPVVADIFIDELDKKALEELHAPPKIWHRFVDNVISVILSSDEAWLLDHLNEQHPRITFTIERENERKMPFMDVLFKRGEDRRWTEPCTKSQHTGQYLSFDSHHPTSNVELFEGLLTEQSRFAVTKNQRRGKSGTSWVKCKEMAI